MASIDERVVAMAFENAKFESGIATTMRSLAKLDTAIQQVGQKNSLGDIEKAANKVTLQQPMSALDKLKSRFGNAGQGAAQGFNEIEKAGSKVQLVEPIRALGKVEAATGQVGRGASDGFNEIEKAANHLDLRGATNALESLASRFTLLSGAATVAFGNIQAQAALKGASFAKSFAFGPIQQGFQEYQTNLSSIQTILANTQGSGGNLKTVNAALQELNTYSDKTIYNFSEMAKNIGTFTAAGVQLKPATAAIKGIANLAALSGSNSQQASTAMYQLSQAIAAGRVGLQDWNSVVNAGMGGAVFQKSLMRTAENMGTIEKGAIKIDKATGKATVNGQSFRESIMAKPGQQSWLTSEVLTNTLSQLTGDMSNAELAAKGFSAEQIKAIQAQAKSAQDAATQVKTLPQVFDVARETIGSGWSKTFQTIFGDFGESKKSFTDLSNFLNSVINKGAKARNNMLAEWKKLGGRDVLIQGLKQAFKDLGLILKPIREAFRDIFPAKTGKDLFAMTKNFADLTKRLQPSKEVVDGLHRTFRGLFAVLHIGWSVVKGVIGVFGELLGTVGKGSGGFLNFTGSIGDFLVAVDNALTKGGLLTGFFHGIASALKLPLQLLSGLASAIFHLFSGVDTGAGGKVTGALNSVKGAATPLASALDKLKHAWDGFVHILGQAKDLVSPWLTKIGDQLSRIGDVVLNAFRGGNFDKTMSLIQTGLVAGIFIALKKAIGGASGQFVGILKPLNSALGTLTNSLTAMQKNVQAQTIVLIATAIGLLAVSTYALAQIDAAGLAKAMTAIAIGLGELVGAVAILSKVAKGGAFLTMPILAASLVLLAGSMVILATAAKIFSTMSWDGIAKGLVGIGGGLAAIGVGMKFLGPGTIVQAPALLVLSVALNAIALAVKQFAGLSWTEIAKGLAGVLGSLVAMIAPITEAGPMLTIAAPGVIGIAFALNMLAAAVKSFGQMNLKQLITGLIGATLALAGIGVAMWAIPPHAALLGAGLIVVAIGLGGIAAAVKAFGSMDISTLAKGLIAMGVALIELAVGLTAMIASLPGAAALLVAAAALAILAPTLGFLGTLDWGTIFKGLAAIALTLGTIAIAGTLAAPGLILLGTALLPLGLAFTLVSAAAYLFALAIQKVANDGAKGVGILIGAIAAFIAVLPTLIINLIKGMVEILGQLAAIAPKVVDSLVKIVNSLIEVVIKSAPRLGLAIGVLVGQFLTIIIRDSPKLIQAGVTLLLNLLRGIDQNISQVINRGASIILKFLSGLASHAAALVSAGASVLVQFLTGITQNLPRVVGHVAKLISVFLGSVASHIPEVAASGTHLMVKFVGAVGAFVGHMVAAGVNMLINFLKGVGKQIPKVINAAIDLAGKFVRAVAHGLLHLTAVGVNAIIDFMNATAHLIRQQKFVKRIFDAGWNIASAIIDGIIQGFKDLFQKVKNWVSDQINGMIDDVKNALDIFSPSKVFRWIGQMTMKGLQLGLEDGGKDVHMAMGKVVDGVIHNSRDTFMSGFEWLGKGLVNGMRAGLLGMASALQSGVTGPLQALLAHNKDMRAFGQFLGGEFRQGLTGGLWSDGKSDARKQIEGAFTALKTKLGEEQQKLRDGIKQDQDKLKQLLGDKTKNWTQINALRGNIANEQALLSASKASSNALIAGMAGEEAVLIKLAARYASVTVKLDAAKQSLADLKQKRDDAIKSYTEQFSQLPDIAGLLDTAMADAAMTYAERWDAQQKKQEEDRQRSQINQVANYQKALKDQIAATQQYMATLNKLRALGLDDTTFKKLLDMGTAGQSFASQLLAGGKGAITEINKLDTQLTGVAGELGKGAAKELYQNGIDIAKGIVKGLQDQQQAIRDIMTGIAKSMVAALKMALGIKSPSRVFAELGQFSVQGLAEGLAASSTLVKDAAAGVGNDAADALTNSLAGISDRVQNSINTDLTITPVLDLTQVEKDASKIQDLTNVTPITAAASYGQAAAISSDTQANAAAQADPAVVQKTVEVRLEQNNTSPKALDDIEIYRQTKNQLSQVKDALGLAT